MPVVKTQTLRLADVLKWVVHPGFCYEEVSLNNGDIALSQGGSILGHLAFYTGSAWKILDDGDSITAASIICPILHQQLLLADAAGDAAAFLPKCVILRRGPAIVHKEKLTYDAGVVQATVDAAMAAQGIITKIEEGLEYTYASP